MMVGGKLLFAFPGQGSQYAGMGEPLFRAYPEALNTVRRAERITGRALLPLLTEATEEDLKRTENTHPALFLYEAALYDALSARRGPDVVMGHSLGELAALYAAGVIDFETALSLVLERGRIIVENSGGDGGMVALLGENVLKMVEDILRRVSPGKVVISNYNSPKQVVLSGYRGELERVVGFIEKQARRMRARVRAVRLKISFASHSPLVRDASERLAKVLDGIEFRDPVVPMIMNTTGKVATTAEEVKRAVSRQLSSPVRFVDMVKEAVSMGVERMWEVGPGRVLTGLVSQITDRISAEPKDPKYSKVGT